MKKNESNKKESKKKIVKKKITKKKVVKKKVVKKSKVKLISATIGATIPTMAYGNMPFSFSVNAPTIEDALNFVMPKIEELYETYSHTKLKNVKLPEVTVVEKIIEIKKPVSETPKKEVEVITEKKVETIEDKIETPKTEADALSSELEVSPAFSKASRAIGNAMSLDALAMIESQIQKSVKLSDDEKPALLSEVLKKRKELKTV